MNRILSIRQIKDMSFNELINMYRQGYHIQEVQDIPIPVNVCQKAGQSGWAACDELGGMCENTNCPGECSDFPTTNCGCVATCSGVLPSQIPIQQPSSTLPPTTLSPTTLPPVSVTPPSTQCRTDQFNILLLGCQDKYKTILIGGVGIVTLFLLMKWR